MTTETERKGQLKPQYISLKKWDSWVLCCSVLWLNKRLVHVFVIQYMCILLWEKCWFVKIFFYIMKVYLWYYDKINIYFPQCIDGLVSVLCVYVKHWCLGIWLLRTFSNPVNSSLSYQTLYILPEYQIILGQWLDSGILKLINCAHEAFTHEKVNLCNMHHFFFTNTEDKHNAELQRTDPGTKDTREFSNGS